MCGGGGEGGVESVGVANVVDRKSSRGKEGMGIGAPGATTSTLLAVEVAVDLGGYGFDLSAEFLLDFVQAEAVLVGDEVHR